MKTDGWSHCYGSEEGASCRRDSCAGIIQLKPVEDCSCHLHPPCGACTAPRLYCDTCDWREEDDVEVQMNDYIITQNKSSLISTMRPRDLDKTKIDYYSKGHSHCSMVKEGVYPEGATEKEVESKVKGTFGGRFESFGGGRFRYVAYTD